MKLYWRYKKNGKWTWKAATKTSELLEARDKESTGEEE